MRRFLVLLIVLLLTAPTARVLGRVEITVLPDRVAFGTGEFLPRRLDLPAVVAVPAGESGLLAAGVYDYVEAAGSLTITGPVSVTTLVVLPGGRLDIACGALVTLRDVPIDTSRDPFQWGNGLVVFGHLEMTCPLRTPKVLVDGDIESGATTLTLSTAPIGWQVGDELLLPDTAQQVTTQAPRREAPIHVASLAGSTLTLAAPVGFAHPAVRDPDGVVRVLVRVANLTRPTLVRGEGSVRGHVAAVGRDASWRIQGVRLDGLGRTKAEPLHNTTPTQIGTNQIGRYGGLHAHHAESRPDLVRTFTDNVVVGAPSSKWGAAIMHGTSGTLIADNICVGFTGCYVTEDGNEVGNVFRNNIAAYGVFGPIGVRQNATNELARRCPGCEGAAYWMHSVQQVIENNEAWNGRMGFNLVNIALNAGTLGNPISFTGNTAIGVGTGLETWNQADFVIDRFVSVQHSRTGVLPGSSNGNGLRLRGALLLGDIVPAASCGKGGCPPASVASGIHSDVAYIVRVEVEDSEIRGFDLAISGGLASGDVILRRVLLQNRRNLVVGSAAAKSGPASPHTLLLDAVTHRPLGTYPHDYIRFGDDAVWVPGVPLATTTNGWTVMQGSRFTIRNWQGTGQDYLLFERQALASAPAWSAASATSYAFCPEASLTMGQCWTRYGLAYQGDVLQPSDVLVLDGLTAGAARQGLAHPLGLPRSVLTYPNAQSPAAANPPLQFILTGLASAATREVVYALDGGPAVTVAVPAGTNDRVTVPVTLGAGPHVVEAWRVLNGVEIPTSRLTFPFVVQ